MKLVHYEFTIPDISNSIQNSIQECENAIAGLAEKIDKIENELMENKGRTDLLWRDREERLTDQIIHYLHEKQEFRSNIKKLTEMLNKEKKRELLPPIPV